MVHPVKYGKRTRMSYSRVKNVFDMPNLLEVQTESYDWFIKHGIREVFDDISPIEDYAGNLILEFVDYKLDKKLKYTEAEARLRDANYSAGLRAKVRLINKDTGEVKEQEVFMGDLPLMTKTGTFIINGAERVIVSQLVRSPGAYYTSSYDKNGNLLVNAQLIPNRGAWLEFETDTTGSLSVRVDRTRKVPLTTLLRAFEIESNDDIIEAVGDTEVLQKTFEKDPSTNKSEAVIEIYKRLRPGEPATEESATSLLYNMFFDYKRYDLAKVGRYKFNKKLGLANRIKYLTLAEDVADPNTGEVLFEAGKLLSYEDAKLIEDSGINSVFISNNGKKLKVVGNWCVDTAVFKDRIDLEKYGIHEKVYYPAMMEIINSDDLEKAVMQNIRKLYPKHILISDVVASVNYELLLFEGVGNVDDIDHLANRRIRCVGELLQNQFRIGLARMERVVRERMTIQDMDYATPQALINIRPVVASIKEFFGSSQLSQFMDQTNPLSELTHKRKMSALGPGGLSRDRAGFEVRDVHNSHYGRMCPIETPEGPNIGLMTSLTTYARINEYGFIEAPYRKVKKPEGIVTDEIVYLMADEEYEKIIAQSNEKLDENNRFVEERVVARGHKGIIDVFKREDVDYMDVSPQQIVAVGTALIPFLEKDDAKRALMGANMQRQAVPLITTEAPLVGTGIEYKAAVDSGVVIIAQKDGVVESVDATKIVVKSDDGKKDVYNIGKFIRSNQGTTINQRPIVVCGEKIKKGQVIADGPSTNGGEMAIGKNVLVGFMTWEGYNYEDAILINEKLVVDDVLTSVHIEEYEIDARDTKLGPEEITRDIPNVGDDMLKDLDEEGIIRIGAEVTSGDILVGKVTPKGETELAPEERLLRAIFGEKAREVRDTSLKVPHGETGIVVDVRNYTREAGDELPPGVNRSVRVYIATKRKIMVGDKMCGRHGNKGVISRILPEEDMPYLPDGTPLQICLNPQGIPSRMNLGQVLEVHLGLAAKKLGAFVETPVFDGANEKDIVEALKEAGYPETGMIEVRDGRTGLPFDRPVAVGYMYMVKLHHMVDEKIHARSTGPYSLVTQQPLGGKAQFGGQRFGEMEVWALEGYGASHVLQEMLTVKSDDIVGRVKTYEAIVKGENIPEPGVPESFKVLIKELQSLALDVKVLDENKNEIELKEYLDDEPTDLNEITREMSTTGSYEDYSYEPENDNKEISLDNLKDKEDDGFESFDDIDDVDMNDDMEDDDLEYFDEDDAE
ncbi:MAG: DNA-directed RNA polymerase subunit beta [Ezakiella sp.]|nr:DNA-directed RNA polymerase subunit beta [Ezakiella sp.]MDD7472331.1 DNA-directed RNA polymerase subunit beta [Bacillota bacterium]MDY3923068.1 DNA-directed RNA polymerase subunit beta [Ezakiella sp.]